MAPENENLDTENEQETATQDDTTPKVFTEDDVNRAISKALKTNSDKLQKKWEQDKTAELARQEAIQKGEFETLYNEVNDKYTKTSEKAAKYEESLKARFETEVATIPESLAKLIPEDADYLDKLDVVATMRKEIDAATKAAAEAVKPGNTGGGELDQVVTTAGTTLTREQVLKIPKAQLVMMSKADRERYRDLYGYGVFERV